MRPLISAAFGAVLGCSLAAQTICLDPGHPSENGVGTRGKTLTEVGVAWEVALSVKFHLVALGYTVVLTKTRENQLVTNAERAAIANKNKADLVVRLHCDAGTGSGFAVYYPKKQGKVGKSTGPSLDVRRASGEMATVFHGELARLLKGSLKNNGLHGDERTYIGSKQGALTGSILSKVPVLLVEMCVLQNRKDEAFVASEKGRAVLVSSLTGAIRASVALNPKKQRSTP